MRADRERSADLVSEPGVEPMEMRGHPMAGWLRVSGPALTAGADVARWVAVVLQTARRLPVKSRPRTPPVYGTSKASM